MNSGNTIQITPQYYDKLIAECSKLGYIGSYQAERHQWVIENTEGWLVKLFLPWNSRVDNIGRLLPKDDYHLALVMIRAGIATTGYFHNGVMQDHKIFRAYMVRKKQGKSQIKHLKTKGKSRAGSRVRLGESEEFFEEINRRLAVYAANFPIDHWGISCSKTLLPFFFESHTSPPFSRDQTNLFTIPFHVQEPNFGTLKLIHGKVNSLHMVVSPAGDSRLPYPLFPHDEATIENDPSDEDW